MTEIAPRPYEPDVAIHPGATIRDVIESKGMTQQELADRMERPANKINEILQGKRGITADTAFQLQLVLRWPATFWMERDRAYELAKKRAAAEAAVPDPKAALGDFPVKEMTRLGWIRKQVRPGAQVLELLEFFGITSVDRLGDIVIEAPAFRKVKGRVCRFALAAWLRRGHIEAEGVEVERFNAARLKRALPDLRALTLLPPDEFEPRLVELCASCGVAVVFVHHLPNSHACGAAYWIGDKAAVQLSLRLNSDDQLWFSFFHEIAHILLHGRRKAPFVDDFKESEDAQEVEANHFASRLLIPDTEYTRLVGMPFRTEATVRKFAREIGVAPGIVVDRLQHDKLLPFSHMQGLKTRFSFGE